MGLSKTRRRGRSGFGGVALLTQRAAPRRRYLTASAVTAGGLLLLTLPVIVLRLRNGAPAGEPEALGEAAPDPGPT